MRKLNHISPSKIAGFSLIEFMVASILSMIILVAVSSGYFISRKLSDTALARLSVQQDVRNVANMIVRDARMAGNFGCFNMANSLENSISEYKNQDSTDNIAKNLTTNSQNTLVPIKILAANTQPFRRMGFNSNSDILIFQYGMGSSSITNTNGNSGTIQIPQDDPLQTANNNMPLIFSSCKVLDKPKSYTIKKNGNTINITNITPELKSIESINELSILRYIENAYAVGTFGNQQGLFRFQLGDDGEWTSPQLLLANVTNMEIQYGYVNNCIASGTAANENFEFTNTLKVGGDAPTPAFIRITLNSGNIPTSTSSGKNAGNIYIYQIDATIRGGNKCADRTI